MSAAGSKTPTGTPRRLRARMIAAVAVEATSIAVVGPCHACAARYAPLGSNDASTPPGAGERVVGGRVDGTDVVSGFMRLRSNGGLWTPSADDRHFGSGSGHPVRVTSVIRRRLHVRADGVIPRWLCLVVLFALDR